MTITGVIVDNRAQRALLERIAKADSAKALVVSINSPGGITAGSEALYEALRKVAEKKPVVARMGTLATSGGYIAALGADHVVARKNTITGSIGVVFQWPDVSKLLDTVGVKYDTVKSAPLKAEPSPFTPASEEVREAIRSLVTDSYEWFIGLVAERCGIDRAEARRLGNGRVYSGNQALKVKLVDAIGGDEAVRGWLAENHDIPKDLPLRDWKSESILSGANIARSAIAAVARAVGLEGLAADIAGGAAIGDLDGLVSLWHPSMFEE